MTITVTEVTSDGKEVYVHESEGNHIALVPRALLDDETGDDSSAEHRKKWVVENSDEISKAIRAKTQGGVVRLPFDQVIIGGKL